MTKASRAENLEDTVFNTLCAASGYFSLKIHKYAAESAPPTDGEILTS